MIRSIEIQGFKSLEHVKLQLGNLNLFVGTNASGKSNFFDALRVLQGIGYGFTIDEILNGKPKGATSEVWEGIRGGSSHAAFARPTADGQTEPGTETTFSVAYTAAPDGTPVFDYSIAISPPRGQILRESLVVEGRRVFESGKRHAAGARSPLMAVVGQHSAQLIGPIEYTRSFLHALAAEPVSALDGPLLPVCIKALSDLQRLDPSPPLLRGYSQAFRVNRLGERGENFSALVRRILENEDTKAAFLSWLRQLVPTEVDDVRILEGAVGEPMFATVEHGTVYPAPILSDGTLRFAAITAAFFQPDMPQLLLIEEIENAIHASRLRLLVELLRSQAKQGRQIMATTHSPIVLAWLKPEEYATTFFCKRDEATGASVIRPLTDVPGFMDVVRKRPIGDLFAEGWLEGAL